VVQELEEVMNGSTDRDLVFPFKLGPHRSEGFVSLRWQVELKKRKEKQNVSELQRRTTPTNNSPTNNLL
jgi:hypothetical protein